MKESELDTEKIAALLAGKLDERDRSAALERLASSGDDLRLFIETAAVLREIEEEESAKKPPPSVSVPRWRRRRMLWIAPVLTGAAAVLVLIVVLRRPSAPRGLAAPVALLSRPGLPPGIIDRHRWNQTMGGPAALSSTARAARAGALHTELALALRSGDAAAAEQVVVQMQGVLAGVPTGTPALDTYERAVREPDRQRAAALLAQAGDGAAALLGSEWMAAGGWAEAGRIAAAEHDTAFFSAPSTRAALEQIGRLGGLGDSARTALQQVRAELRSGHSPRWNVLEAGMRDLLGALAS